MVEAKANHLGSRGARDVEQDTQESEARGQRDCIASVRSRRPSSRASFVAVALMLLGSPVFLSVVMAQEGRGSVEWTAVEEQVARQVEVAPELILGDEDGPGMLCSSRRLRVTRDGSGNTYVSSGCDCKVQVFDPRGRFSTAFGQCGEGPGEMTRIDGIAAGKWVYVAGAPARVLVYSPAFVLQGQFSVPAGRVNSVAILANGNLGINYRAGTGLYEFGPDGARVASFHNDFLREGSDRAGPGWLGFFALAADDAGRLWAARMMNRYDLGAWRSGSEEAVVALSRRPDWYKPYEGGPTGNPMLGPIGLSWFDGLLWTFLQRPKGSSTAEGRPEYDFLVDAIDPERGLLVGQAELEPGFVGWAGNMLWRMADTGDGGLVIHLYRVTLR